MIRTTIPLVVSLLAAAAGCSNGAGPSAPLDVDTRDTGEATNDTAVDAIQETATGGSDGGPDTVMSDSADIPDDGQADGDTPVDAHDTAAETSWGARLDVLVLNYDPIIDSSGERAHAHYEWHDPHTLADRYAADMAEASGGAVRYRIAEWRDLDVYPRKVDGFRYDDSTWATCLNDREACHKPDTVDYTHIIRRHDLCEKVEAGTYDEIWMFGGPYFGYWESTMAGDDAFFLNSPAVPDITCERDFVIMGFNYERDVALMLHNFGHRTEFTMRRAYRDWSPDAPHPFARFSRHETSDPGQARCGNTHFPPNGAKDYDYANDRTVETTCHQYADFPTLDGSARPITCEAWNCTQRGYMTWWFRQLPDNRGMSDGYQNNWWKYLVGFNEYLFSDDR